MIIKRFDIEKDLKRLENYLRDCYSETKSMTSWLPERLHDLIYRMDVQYTDCGQPRSADYIFMWEEDSEIVAALSLRICLYTVVLLLCAWSLSVNDCSNSTGC